MAQDFSSSFGSGSNAIKFEDTAVIFYSQQDLPISFELGEITKTRAFLEPQVLVVVME